MQVKIEGYVFGPHAATFRLEGDGQGDDGKVFVKHCSVLLPAHRAAAFDVPARGNARLDVSHSLFSRLDVTTNIDTEGAVLLRQADGGDSIAYTGRDNVYHDLDGYWAVGNEWRKAGWGDFRKRSGTEDSSRLVMTRPWEFEPGGVKGQAALLEKQELAQAFRVNEKLPASANSPHRSRKPLGPSPCWASG